MLHFGITFIYKKIFHFFNFRRFLTMRQLPPSASITAKAFHRTAYISTILFLYLKVASKKQISFYASLSKLQSGVNP